MAKTKKAVQILLRVNRNNKSVKTGIVQAKLNFEVAQMIYDARTKANSPKASSPPSLDQNHP